ncbi:MAG: hypothetical protein SGPRY_005221 [Prymnesium sp.]
MIFACTHTKELLSMSKRIYYTRASAMPSTVFISALIANPLQENIDGQDQLQEEKSSTQEDPAFHDNATQQEESIPPPAAENATTSKEASEPVQDDADV